MGDVVIYEARGIVRTTLDDDKVIVVTWERFPADGHFRPCLDAQVAKVNSGECTVIIVDVRKTKGVPLQEDQAYLTEVIFPQYKRARIGAVITIVPESAITRMGSKRWMTAGAQFGFKMFEALSVRDARALMRAEGLSQVA